MVPFYACAFDDGTGYFDHCSGRNIIHICMVFLRYGNACGLPDDAHKQMQMDISDIYEVSHLFKKKNGGETSRVAHLWKVSCVVHSLDLETDRVSLRRNLST